MADKWADSLVDLSHRNGLIWRKDSGTTTLDVADARPEALSGFLVGKGPAGRAVPDPEQHAKAWV